MRENSFKYPFDFEDKHLQNFCIEAFNNSDSYEWLRKYMFENETFMNLIIEKQEYKYISKENICKMSKYIQDTNLIIYVTDLLTIEKLIEYFSSIAAFKDKEAMMCAVDYVIANGLCKY